jgi:hypothetical protein
LADGGRLTGRTTQVPPVPPSESSDKSSVTPFWVGGVEGMWFRFSLDCMLRPFSISTNLALPSLRRVISDGSSSFRGKLVLSVEGEDGSTTTVVVSEAE